MSRGRKLLSRAMGKAGEMGQWLKLLAALPETRNMFPEATVGSLQSPVTPALGDSDAVFCPLQTLQTTA